MKQKAPVLLIIFYRPDLTARVFDAIKKYQPKELFIAADGPRNEQEALICAETRAVVEDIDWDCKVQRLYQNENLGCKMAVTQAITWFFENVEEGIILEDDCVPHADFFDFCESMLTLYRNDQSIGLISGTNFFPLPHEKNHNHYLSPIAHIWGWASWRRVWKNYQIDPVVSNDFQWKKMPGNTHIQKMSWFIKLCKIHWGEINTWDYQLQYTVSYQDQMTVIPIVNLIENIGFDERATHTQSNPISFQSNPISAYKESRIPAHEIAWLIKKSIHEKTQKNFLITLLRYYYCKFKLK